MHWALYSWSHRESNSDLIFRKDLSWYMNIRELHHFLHFLWNIRRTSVYKWRNPHPKCRYGSQMQVPIITSVVQSYIFIFKQPNFQEEIRPPSQANGSTNRFIPQKAFISPGALSWRMLYVYEDCLIRSPVLYTSFRI